MNYKCFVPTCTNTKRICPEKVFFYVSNSVKKKWCRQVNVPNHPRHQYYCCEDHLNLAEDIENYYYWKFMKVRPVLKSTTILKLNSNEPSQSIENIQEPSELEKLLTISDTANAVQDLSDTGEDILPQCLFCAQYKDCIDLSIDDENSAKNYFTLTFNEVHVVVDLNNKDLPKTVCRSCDLKLLEMHKFVSQVYEAQQALIRGFNQELEEEIEALVIKEESEDPLGEVGIDCNKEIGEVSIKVECEDLHEESVEIEDCNKDIGEVSVKVEREDLHEESVEIENCNREIEEVSVKEECEDIHEESVEIGDPDDSNEDKDGIVDSLTVTETELVPQRVMQKRKVDEPKPEKGKPAKKYKLYKVTGKGENANVVIVKEVDNVNDRNNRNNETCDSNKLLNETSDSELAANLFKKGS